MTLEGSWTEARESWDGIKNAESQCGGQEPSVVGIVGAPAPDLLLPRFLYRGDGHYYPASLLLNIPFGTAITFSSRGLLLLRWSFRLLWSRCPSCTSAPCSDSAGTTNTYCDSSASRTKRDAVRLHGRWSVPDGGSLSRIKENIPDIARSMARGPHHEILLRNKMHSPEAMATYA